MNKISFATFSLFALLLVGAGCSSGSNTSLNSNTPIQSNDTSNIEPSPVLAAATTTPTTAETAPKPVAKPSTAQSATNAVKQYTDALAIYRKSGYYFQFVDCHGNPGSLTIKKGVKFMMDNRDSTSHRFVVAGQSYTIPGYGFTIVTANKVGEHNITCDGGGAAKIKIVP